MPASLQTFLALALAGLALAYLLWTWLRPKRGGGCAGCGPQGLRTDRTGPRGGPVV